MFGLLSVISRFWLLPPHAQSYRLMTGCCRYKDGELNVGESACLDRCASKYWQVRAAAVRILGKCPALCTLPLQLSMGPDAELPCR